MPLKSPILDDRDYKQIIEEAKRLIPVYAPEWTDWNEHDPGISLIQLFSHLTEMIIYRLNQVPDKNYIEFLKLIGTELKPATPAEAHLTFTLSEDTTAQINIPKNTPVETESSGDDEPIIFETDESLIATNIKLKSVQSSDGGNFSDRTGENNNDGQSFYPFGEKVIKDNALYLGFSHPLKFPEIEIGMRVELYTNGLPAESSHCDIEDDKKIHPSSELIWEYCNDKNDKNWEKLDIIKDETRGFFKSGYIHFKGPSDIEKSYQGLLTKADEKEEEENKLNWIRCKVNNPGYESSPKIDMILLNTVPATNAVSVKDEIIGSSDAYPDQVFNLRNIPVLSGSLFLEVDEGDGWKEWRLVDDFNGSKRHDQHYTLNRVTGEIKFGDGINGKIPFAGDNNIKATYRYGGGENGNVGAGTITQPSISDVEEVTNKRAAIGGEDEETIKKVKERVPLELKTRHRAVTSEDFEFLAKETLGARVERAKAIPLYHPGFSADLKIPGVVTVIVVPHSEDNKPLPSEGTIQNVCEHLNKHRLLTTELYVVPPKYKKVKIDADIIADNRADLGQVKNAVEVNLGKYFHPLTGGIDENGWPFGGDIYFSEAYRVVLNTSGVKRIDRLAVYVDEKEQPHCEDLKILDHYLVYSDGHDIEVYYNRVEE